MLSDNEKQELEAQAKTVKDRIHSIRQELTELTKQREEAFKKRNTSKNSIIEQINTVKGLKGERNSLTSEVKLSKEEKDKIIKKIPELSKQVKELKDKRNRLSEKLGPRVEFGKIKREIESMERKIETVPMSFSAEKKLMDQIKSRKKQMEASNEIRSVSKEIRSIAQELESYIKIRNASRAKVQSVAKESQEKHVAMVEEHKKIDDLRTSEKEAHDAFMKLKTATKEKADELKAEQNKLTELHKKLGIDSEQIKKKQAQAQAKSLSEQRKVVEEKMKKGEKLTTDDLLVMQSEK